MYFSVRRITFTAIIMAINILFSSFGIPLGFSTLYLTDIAVCTAGILLDPFSAFIAGAVGAFIGDVFFYPKAMLVTLSVRAVQVVIISVFTRYIFAKKPMIGSIVGCIIGTIVMACGYAFLGGAVYGTMEGSLAKLPLEFLQAAVGVIVAIPVSYKFGLRSAFNEYLAKDGKNKPEN